MTNQQKSHFYHGVVRLARTLDYWQWFNAHQKIDDYFGWWSDKNQQVPVTCRLDSDAEVQTYKADGVLQQFAKEFLADNA